MSYPDLVRRHRRLALLRHLEGCSGYVSNTVILADVLSGLGLHGTYDQLMTDIRWLADQGFVDFEDAGAACVVRATRGGVEIARGLTTHPGVQRPHPEA